MSSGEEPSPLQEDDDNNGKIKDYVPAEDVFSMIMVSPVFSYAFLYSFTIYVMQLLILILFVVNLLKDSNSMNRFVIPVMTGIEVQFGQLIALVVTVMMADDVTSSLNTFYVQYDPDVEKDFPHASKFKWYMTRQMRCSEGLLSIIVAFIFIVQSDKNLDLFLNFAAVTFVSELDNVGFAIADNGYNLIDLKELTADIKEKLVFKKQNIDPPTRHKVQQRVVGALLLFLIAGWTTAITKQLNGEYYDSVCQTFQVQFENLSYDYFHDFCIQPDGEGICPPSWQNLTEIFYYSFNDFYAAQRDERGNIILENRRPVYYQQSRKKFDAFGDDSPAGKISYCLAEQAWIFSIQNVSKGSIDQVDGNQCNWLMKSKKTDQYNLDEVSTDEWVVWTGVLEVSKNLEIACIECDVSDNTSDKNGKTSNPNCNYHGECSIDQTCECHLDWMGGQCQTCFACTSLTVKLPHVDKNITFDLFYEDEINKTIPENVHERPLYYANKTSTTLGILFNGAAFSIYNLSHQENLSQFLDTYHSTWDINSVPLYSTGPTESYYPFNLNWNDVKTGEEAKIDIWCPTTDKAKCPFVFN